MADPPSTSSSSPTPTPTPAFALSAASLLLTLDDPTHNPVEEAGPNHFERPAPTLTPLEQFYVDVAHSFAQEEVTRRTTTAQTGKAAVAAGTAEEEARKDAEEMMVVHQYLGRTRTTLQHFASMLDKLLHRKTLNVAFAHPDSQQAAGGSDDKPTDPAFLLSRRNRLAVLIQSHSSTLTAAAQSLTQQSDHLTSTLALTHRYTADLSHLAAHWMLRVRPITAATAAAAGSLVPPVVVDVGWDAGGESRGVRLDRDGQGRVAVGEDVGKRSEREEQLWRRTRQRRERHKQPQQQQQHPHMTAEQKQNEEEMQWETDDNAPTQPSSSATPPTAPQPPASASFSSLPGWPRTASRLHRHQRHLLQLQMYNALMAEAKGWQSPQLSSVSVLSHTIHCHSPAFPPLSVSFDDGPQHPFILLTSTDGVDSHALYLSLLSQLTRHHIRYATNNQPTPNSLPAATANDQPPLPHLLHHLITTVYHAHLATTIRTALHTALAVHAPNGAVELIESTEGGGDWVGGSVNVMRFVLKRRGGGGGSGGSGLLLDGVVDGVSMHAVVRRGKRLGVLGSGSGSGGDDGMDVSGLDVELVRCVNVAQMVQLIQFVLQSTSTV